MESKIRHFFSGQSLKTPEGSDCLRTRSHRSVRAFGGGPCHHWRLEEERLDEQRENVVSDEDSRRDRAETAGTRDSTQNQQTGDFYRQLIFSVDSELEDAGRLKIKRNSWRRTYLQTSRGEKSSPGLE